MIGTLPDVYTTAVLNQKGGVGKTGATVGAAGALAERGRRVLLVDLDPQGHLTTEALGLEEGHQDANLAQALAGHYTGPTDELIVTHSKHASGGCLDVLPTSLSMFLVVRELYMLRNQERRLAHQVMRNIDGDTYDHVIIDCPPSLDVLTDNALVSADGVLIPVQPAKTSVRALRLLLEQISALEDELGLQRRTLLGLVPSLYRNPVPSLARHVGGQIEAFARDEQGIPIPAHITTAVAVEEAWFSGTPTTEYAPRSPQAEGYRRIAIRLDVAAGLSAPEEWNVLPPVRSLARTQDN